MSETPLDGIEAQPSEEEIDALLQEHPIEIRLSDPALKLLEFPDTLQKKVASRVLQALRINNLTLVPFPPKIFIIFESSQPKTVEGISYMQYKAVITLFTNRGPKKMPYVLYVPIVNVGFIPEDDGAGVVH